MLSGQRWRIEKQPLPTACAPNFCMCMASDLAARSRRRQRRLPLRPVPQAVAALVPLRVTRGGHALGCRGAEMRESMSTRRQAGDWFAHAASREAGRGGGTRAPSAAAVRPPERWQEAGAKAATVTMSPWAWKHS